jgi:carbon-monoxide dehydrogenase small subunit
MSKIHVSAVVNGEPIEYLCDPAHTLLDVLRDQLGLTGSKEGCGSGDCGACSVTIDGRLTCACLVLGAEVDGMSIGTIEGLAQGDQLHPLQKKFVEMAALQCGVCTPGVLVAAKALLDRNHSPTDAEIREGMEGALCRCMTYYRIQAAIKRVVSNSATALFIDASDKTEAQV